MIFGAITSDGFIYLEDIQGIRYKNKLQKKTGPKIKITNKLRTRIRNEGICPEIKEHQVETMLQFGLFEYEYVSYIILIDRKC